MPTETTKTEVGSHFISNYPPYSQWTTEQVGAAEEALRAQPAQVPLGLYLHIPFCRKRCKFCYFRVFTDRNASEIERYMAALSREIELVSQLPAKGDRDFRFVYFGGGTPSYLSVKQLHRLTERLHTSIHWDKAEEVTFECEPGTLPQPKVQAIRELGVTRLSLGVENFSDQVLEENGRAHLSKEVYRAWEWITAANFTNVNIDLIAGMVGETWENWRDNIRRTIELSPDSVTIYQMELPYNTVYSKDILNEGKQSPVADWETKRAWVSEAFDALAEAGYHPFGAYTMIKDPDKISFSYRDNLWRGSDMIATGIASFGHISGVHYQNHPEWEPYLSTLERGELPLWRAYHPTPLQALIREMILQLKSGKLEIAYFADKFDVNILDHWSEVWHEYRDQGFLTFDTGTRIELTRKGLLQADGLLPAFFEPEHRGIRYT